MDDIWNHIVSNLQNRTAAENTVNRIMDAVDQLETYALIGPSLSAIAEMDGEYRFLVSGNYMVFYRVNGNDIYIDRVLYGRRDYLRILFSDNQGTH